MDGNTHNHHKSSLDLEFFIDPLVLPQIVPQLLVKTVAPGCLNYMRGEDLKREATRFDRRDRQVSDGH